MLEKIKERIILLKGKRIKIKVDIGRNKIEEYYGTVYETYNNVWTFKTGSEIKSFSYKDILIKSVVISPY